MFLVYNWFPFWFNVYVYLRKFPSLQSYEDNLALKNLTIHTWKSLYTVTILFPIPAIFIMIATCQII